MPPAPDDLRRYFVVDAEGGDVGHLVSYWTEGGSSRPTFAAVRGGRLMPRVHVVPLEGARLDEERRLLRVPYPRAVVLDAPVVEEGAMLSVEAAEAARSHYLGKSVPETLELYGEVPHAERRVVSAGGVRLRKVVRKEIVHVPVEVLREDFVLEPIAPGEELRAGDAEGIPEEPFREGSLVVPQFQEEPVIATTRDMLERVRVSRREETETRLVSADLQREDVEIEREPAERESPRGREDLT